MSDVEKKLLDVLIAEIGVEIAAEYDFSLSSELKVTLDYFKETSINVRKLVYLSLISLTMNQEFYNTKEHFFLEDIRATFAINEEMKFKLMRLVYEQKDLDEKVFRVINE
jgi:hypothetical protein